NDIAIEKTLLDAMNELKTQTAKSVNDVVTSLNELIDKENEDASSIYEELEKIYKLIELKEKENNSNYEKLTKRLDEITKALESASGYLKIENGKIRGVNLPEDRIFSDNFRTETIREIVKEQPIIQEVEKKTAPVITKSMLEHYFDYGVKLSEEV